MRMTQHEYEYRQRVTAGSIYQWVEDSITRLNGNGNLFYTGGEDGIYMLLSPDGKLMAETYDGAFPHIGEACFTPKAEHQLFHRGRLLPVFLHLGLDP